MDTYNSLLEGGWRMSEIDSMDMLGFLGVRAWNARKGCTHDYAHFIDREFFRPHLLPPPIHI